MNMKKQVDLFEHIFNVCLASVGDGGAIPVPVGVVQLTEMPDDNGAFTDGGEKS